jgi:hypothetical protein
MSAAIAAAVLGIMVVGFLTWVTNEYRLSKRSHAWAQSLDLAESGVELGLAELNLRYFPNGLAGSFTTATGWSNPSGGVYTETVSNFTDNAGNVIGNFTVTVSGVGGNNPTVLGVGTSINLTGTNASRAVSCVTKRASGGYGLIGINGISFTNPGFTVDSYSSCSGPYGGANVNQNATLGSLTGTVTFKNPVLGVAILGSTATLDMQGGASFQSGGGPIATTPAQALADGYIRTISPTFSNVVIPFDTNTVSNLGNINGSTTISGGDYNVNQIILSGGSVTMSGSVRIYVIGDLKLSGSAAIYVPVGSSCEVYMGGAVTCTGSGVINDSFNPRSFALYGLPWSTSQWNWTGSSAFYGQMYAPQTDIKFTGPSGLYGSMVGLSLSTTGGGSFHADECLGVGTTGFPVQSWQEMLYSGGTWVAAVN